MSIMDTGPSPVEVDGKPVLYGDGRTKQAFKDETDINQILRKAQREGGISHLIRHGAQYGDFSDVPDLLTAHERITQGHKIFDDLPSELRREFDNDMFKFFEYVNDPANAGDLAEKLPGLAEPGRQIPAVRRSAASEANPVVSSAPEDPAPQAPPEAPSGPPAEVPASS